MTVEISNDREGLVVWLLLRFHRMQQHTHTHTGPSLFCHSHNLFLETMPTALAALPLLPQHPSTLRHPMSLRQPIRASYERLRQEAKLTAHQSTNNYPQQEDIDGAHCGYRCSIYGYLWCNYSLITARYGTG